MAQALAPLGTGRMKYPTVITLLPGIRLVNQYQPIVHATPTRPPAIPATKPFRQVISAILQAQSMPTVRAGMKVSASKNGQ